MRYVSLANRNLELSPCKKYASQIKESCIDAKSRKCLELHQDLEQCIRNTTGTYGWLEFWKERAKIVKPRYVQKLESRQTLFEFIGLQR